MDTTIDTMVQELFNAIRTSDIEKVKEILNTGFDIHSKGEYSYTPLHMAVLFNNYNICKLLLENGADITIKNEYDRTPLDFVDDCGSSKIIDLFLVYR
jgi:ankyrin repeat protein